MSETVPMAFVTEPGKVELRQRSVPSVGDYDVKLAVKAVTLCGSDLHIFKGKHPAAPLPMAVGHEIAGQVVELGPEVSSLRVGDRVAVEPVLNCGRCHYCRRGDYHLCTEISFQYRAGQGGLTPEFVVHEDWAHRLPADLPYEQGALLEPLSVAVHAVRKGDLQPGQSVAIFGDGPIGLLLLMVTRAVGASQIFIAGAREFRLQRARDLGATLAINNKEDDSVATIRRATHGLGVASSFEAVGLEVTLRQSLRSLRKGGRTIVLGLFEEDAVTLPANIFVQNEVELVGSQGYSWDFQRSIEMIEAGQIDLAPLLTHHFGLSEIQDAFDLLARVESEAIKIAVQLED